MEHERERDEVRVSEARADLMSPVDMFHRLLDRPALERRSNESELEVSLLDALGLIRHDPDRALQPAVPEGRLHPVRVFESESQSDVDRAEGVPLGRVLSVGTLEGLDALLRVRAPPGRLGETHEVVAGQFLGVGQRSESLNPRPHSHLSTTFLP